MTTKKQNEESEQVPALWTPSKFSGSDLLPIAMADGVDEVDSVGRENIDAADLILPTLSLLQGMSEAVTGGVDGAKPGHFCHSGTGEVFAPPLRVLLCAHYRSRALFPKDDKPEHAGLEVCISRDGVNGTRYGSCDDCEHTQWGERNAPPACSESHNFVAITPNGPAVLRFARTNFKTARQFLTTWTMSPKTLWSHPVVLTVKTNTKDVKGKKATYFTMDMRWTQQEAVPPAMQAAARAINAQVMAAHEQGRFGTTDDERSDDLPSGL